MKLKNSNYYTPEANREYFSVSQFKEFAKCEASALAQLRGEHVRKPTTSMLVGSYVDAWFSGEFDEFKALHPELYTKRGELRSEFRKADEIIERLRQDDLFMEYAYEGDKQNIMTGELFGYFWKIKTDCLHPDKIVDLKIVKDFQPVFAEGSGRLPFIEAWGYDIQGAVYQKIVEQNTGKKLPFYIAAATKETVTDYNIFEVPQYKLDVALKVVEYKIDHIADVKAGAEEPKRCEECNYCRNTKRLVAPIIYCEED